MQKKRANPILGTLFVVIGFSLSFSQTLSAVQFYDTTGTKATAKFGWQGNETSGKFFIEAPRGTEAVSIQNGVMNVAGTVAATAVQGNGSALTNVVPKDGSVTTAKIADSSVTEAKITNSAIVAVKIADSAVTTAKIKNGAVTDDKISGVSWTKVSGAPNIPSATVAIGSIDSSKLADTAVTRNKIRNNAIDSNKIADGNITTAKIKSNAITDSKISDVSWAKISGKPTFLISESAVKNIIAFDSIAARTIDIGKFKVDTSGIINSFLQTAGGTLTISRPTGGSVLTISNPTGSSYNGAAGCFTSATTGSTLYSTNTGSGYGLVIGAGNVGIGTTSPTALLHITSPGAVTPLKIYGGGNIGTNILEIASSGQTTPTVLAISDYGNIGIGCANPGIAMSFGNSAQQRKIGLFENGNGANMYGIGCDGADGAANHVSLFANGGEFLTVTQNGNVSINAGNLSVNGSITATGSITGSSDRRFKSSITPLDSSLAKVSKLQGVTYAWNKKDFPKKNFPEGKQIGLIAQEVEKVYPELVNTDAEGYKSLSYDKLTVVLIEAVKEQQKEIALLKINNETHAKENAKLLNRIELLEKK